MCARRKARRRQIWRSFCGHFNHGGWISNYIGSPPDRVAGCRCGDQFVAVLAGDLPGALQVWRTLSNRVGVLARDERVEGVSGYLFNAGPVLRAVRSFFHFVLVQRRFVGGVGVAHHVGAHQPTAVK